MTPPEQNTRQSRTASRSNEISRSLIGVRLAGRYQITEKLATGGMGSVYLAEHLLIHKLVAIKVLHGEMSQDAEMVVRFQREAQAAAAIDHPNICAATDFGRTSHGEFFMVMEYLDGKGLDHVLSAQLPLGPQRTVHIAQQICAVLEQAHRLGIVHRDLKPENVMVIDQSGDPDYVKVMDFGVARIQFADERAVRLTKAGVVYGTPAYMSPEQVTGDEVDHRADLYSLGVMMYEMATGSIPFNGTTVPKVMTQHLNEQPKPPSERAPQALIPPALESVILKLLAKKPADRFPDAASLRQVLLAFDQEPELTNWRYPLTRKTAKTIAKQQAPTPAPLKPKPRAGLGGHLDSLEPQTRSTLLAALTVTLLLAIGGAGFMLYNKRQGADDAEPSAQEKLAISQARDHFLADAKLGSILELMARGEHAKATEALTARSAEFAQNPHYHYYLGVAHIGAQAPEQALKAYQSAINIEPRYAHDKKLIDDTVALLTDRDDKVSTLAEQLIRQKLKAKARAPLAKIADEDRSRATRKRAYTLLKDLKLLDALPPWHKLQIDLKNAVGCNQHREIIEALAKLEDRRALPALKEIDDFPKRGCGKKQRQDCYACVRDDVRVAIDALEKLPEPPKEASAQAEQPATP